MPEDVVESGRLDSLILPDASQELTIHTSRSVERELHFVARWTDARGPQESVPLPLPLEAAELGARTYSRTSMQRGPWVGTPPRKDGRGRGGHRCVQTQGRPAALGVHDLDRIEVVFRPRGHHRPDRAPQEALRGCVNSTTASSSISLAIAVLMSLPFTG